MRRFSLMMLVIGAVAGCRAPHSSVTAPVTAPAAATLSDTVRPGDPRVDGRRLAAGRMALDWTADRNGQRQVMGRMDDQMAVVTRDGRPALQRVLAVQMGAAMLVDSSWSDPRSLAPVAHRSAQPTRTLAVDWEGEAVRGAVRLGTGAVLPRDSTLGLRTFDSSNWDLVLRALDLAPGITRIFPVYDVDQRVSWYAARVRDTTLAAGPGFVVEATLGRTWAQLVLDARSRAVVEQRMGNPQAPMRVVPVRP